MQLFWLLRVLQDAQVFAELPGVPRLVLLEKPTANTLIDRVREVADEISAYYAGPLAKGQTAIT